MFEQLAFAECQFQAQTLVGPHGRQAAFRGIKPSHAEAGRQAVDPIVEVVIVEGPIGRRGVGRQGRSLEFYAGTEPVDPEGQQVLAGQSVAQLSAEAFVGHALAIQVDVAFRSGGPLDASGSHEVGLDEQTFA